MSLDTLHQRLKDRMFRFDALANCYSALISLLEAKQKPNKTLKQLLGPMLENLTTKQIIGLEESFDVVLLAIDDLNNNPKPVAEILHQPLVQNITRFKEIIEEIPLVSDSLATSSVEENRRNLLLEVEAHLQKPLTGHLKNIFEYFKHLLINCEHTGNLSKNPLNQLNKYIKTYKHEMNEEDLNLVKSYHKMITQDFDLCIKQLLGGRAFGDI
jgi:Na+/phosphate symporter